MPALPCDCCWPKLPVSQSFGGNWLLEFIMNCRVRPIIVAAHSLVTESPFACMILVERLPKRLSASAFPLCEPPSAAYTLPTFCVRYTVATREERAVVWNNESWEFKKY